MKKNIVSIALIGTMTLGMVGYSLPTEAVRGNGRANIRSYTNLNKTKDKEESVSSDDTEVVLEESEILGSNITSEDKTSEDKTSEDAYAESMDGEFVDVVEFGAVADANYYNPSNGNYYSDPSFSTPATDATDKINEAIQYASENGIEKVYIPDGNYLIRAKADSTAYIFQYASKGGIQLESNMTLEMSENTTLMTNTVYESGYSLVTVNGKQNVNIIGGKIVGDMDTHPADKHNYCYGITIANASKNVLIDGVEVTKAEDDGIMIVDYLEHLSNSDRADNIEIRNVKSHNNGRQGLTISTGSNIKVINNEFSDQTKHSPRSGIDIELESYDHIGVENVEIRNNTFNGNTYSGVVISDMFNDQPGSLSKNIVISDNDIDGSRFGVIAAGKSQGLEISNNRVKIDHLIDEYSVGVGSTSSHSSDVNIFNNEVISNNNNNHTLGAILMSPRASVYQNTFDGQKIGVAVYTDNTSITDNIISNTRILPIQDTGVGNTIENNNIR